jgi:hypothetical protein
MPLLTTLPGAAVERWKLQYFYDEDRSSLVINDLKFASRTRGIAVGLVQYEKGHAKPATLTTTDGGEHWALDTDTVKEAGVSLFFLNDSLGWMVTEKGIWQTDEGGRNWRKLPRSPARLLRVLFTDPNRGWAVGQRKQAYETTDGGKSWNKVAAAAEPKTNPDHTVYNWIIFVNDKLGMISGWSQPPRREPEAPAWMDPEQAAKRSVDWPHLSITLDTRDGGKTWKPATVSMFGTIERVIFTPNGAGLGLIEFGPTFAYPSEVFRINSHTGKSDRVFREKNRAITDIWAFPSGRGGYLAGIEAPGRIRAPVPEKLKILKTDDFVKWIEMPVDYRATGRRARLAVADAGNIWVATDTGMILKLTSE